MKLLFGAKQAKDSELSRHDMPSSLLSHTFVLEASAVISQPERDPEGHRNASSDFMSVAVVYS